MDLIYIITSSVSFLIFMTICVFIIQCWRIVFFRFMIYIMVICGLR